MNNEGKALAIWGAALQVAAPLIGLVGTVVGMVSSFESMGAGGTGSPEELAGHIGVALISTSIGLILGFVGLVLMLVALFALHYRAPWFFWFLVVFSVLWAFGFPVGTVLGIGLLVYLLTHRAEFKKQVQGEING